MDNNVKYNKVSLQFSKIITTLHEKAVEIASDKNNTIRLINSAFGESQNEFTGAGEYTLFLTPKNETELSEENKDEYLEYVKEYIKYFVGEDAASLVSDDDLQPMMDLRDIEVPTDSNSETPPTTSESYSITTTEKFINETINRIFETEETPSGEESEEPTDKKSEEVKQVSKCVGFYMTYAVDVENQRRTRHGISNAIGKLAKGIFGNVFSDLKNIELKTMGGGSIKIGKLFDPSTYGIGFKIDKNKIESEMSSVIKEAFPRSENVHCQIWDTTTLIDALRNQNKLNIEISTKLKEVKYALGVEVTPNDYSYRQFNKQKIADFFNEASHLDEKFSKFNLTEKDIILVNGFVSKYKFTSGYDKKTRNSLYKSKDPNKTTKESHILDFSDIVTESIITKLFGDMLFEAHGYGLESLGHEDLISIISHIPSIKMNGDTRKIEQGKLRDILERYIIKTDPTLMDTIKNMKVTKDVRNILREKLIKSETTPEEVQKKEEPKEVPEQKYSNEESENVDSNTESKKDARESVDLYIIPSKFIDKVEKQTNK